MISGYITRQHHLELTAAKEGELLFLRKQVEELKNALLTKKAG
jgi:hypothetical protein